MQGVRAKNPVSGKRRGAKKYKGSQPKVVRKAGGGFSREIAYQKRSTTRRGRENKKRQKDDPLD